MVKVRYGLAEQAEAQAYIRNRLENEYSMEADVEILFRSFVLLYLDMLYDGATKEELDALIDNLAEMLLDDCETLAVDEHENNRDEIIAFITREWHGKTLPERLNERCRTFANEIFLLYLIGGLLNRGKDEISQSIVDNLLNPFQNPILIEARELQREGKFVPPVSLDEPHYGRGVVISSTKAVADMCGYAIMEGWGIHDYKEHKDTAIGYYVSRGSSYPCAICDSYVGYHDIDDVDSLPMFHNHCKCFVIWVYNNEES